MRAATGRAVRIVALLAAPAVGALTHAGGRAGAVGAASSRTDGLIASWPAPSGLLPACQHQGTAAAHHCTWRYDRNRHKKIGIWCNGNEMEVMGDIGIKALDEEQMAARNRATPSAWKGSVEI